MDAATVLTTMASIAASLVGFSGLLTAFRTGPFLLWAPRPQQYPDLADPERQRAGLRIAASAVRSVALGWRVLGRTDAPDRREFILLVGAEPALDAGRRASARVTGGSTWR